MSKYYIAYGSNLSAAQMAIRCPNARIVGQAVLMGWQLLFRGCATVEPNPKRNTPVLVWEISEKDEARLDIYESYPVYYRKENLEIELFPTDGGEPRTVTAMIYLMNEGHPLCKPHPSYYKVLEDGYQAFQFPMHVLKRALKDSGQKEDAE